MSHKITCAIILIAAFGLLNTGCFKKKSTEPQYTAKMGGTRHWHGTDYTEYFGTGGHSTSYSFSDSALTLTVIDGKTIFFAGDTLIYARTDSVGKLYTFEAVHLVLAKDWIFYDYTSNRIEFWHQGFPGGMEIENQYFSD